MRLVNKAFYQEPRIVSPEVPVSIYKIDIVLDLKHRSLFNLALEVSDPITKYFRTKFPTPSHRIRDKILIKKGYKPIEIDTNAFPNYDSLTEEEKVQALKTFILEKAE